MREDGQLDGYPVNKYGMMNLGKMPPESHWTIDQANHRPFSRAGVAGRTQAVRQELRRTDLNI